jgi:hypothetical protein
MAQAQIFDEMRIFPPPFIVAAFLHFIYTLALAVRSRDCWIAVLDAGGEHEMGHDVTPPGWKTRIGQAGAT